MKGSTYLFNNGLQGCFSCFFSGCEMTFFAIIGEGGLCSTNNPHLELIVTLHCLSQPLTLLLVTFVTYASLSPMLLLLPCCSVSLSPLLLCHLCYFIASVTLLPLLSCSFGFLVTSVFCYLVTSVISLSRGVCFLLLTGFYRR